MSAAPVLGGRYEVGELIGRGGMADVHLGHDTRLGRQVAIKMLRSDLARDANFLTRFRREAQSAAGLNHPRSSRSSTPARTTASSRSGGATVPLPYIVMEYVDGETLRAKLQREQAARAGRGDPRSPRASSTPWPTATGWASSTATSSRPTS